jgi:hypothetical protein
MNEKGDAKLQAMALELPLTFLGAVSSSKRALLMFPLWRAGQALRELGSWNKEILETLSHPR